MNRGNYIAANLQGKNALKTRTACNLEKAASTYQAEVLANKYLCAINFYCLV